MIYRLENQMTGNADSDVRRNCCINRKKLLYKNDVISEVSIFSNKFCKKIEIIQFLHWIFIKNFQNFLKISKTIVFFVQTRENLTHGFEIFLKNRRKYSIFAIFWGNFFANFRKFSGVLGAPPPDPHEADPQKCFRPTKILATPTAYPLMFHDVCKYSFS